ncbi:MAG TPA: 30S ribosomal protein S20, partial [Rhodanobacteraceae bacterium]
MANIQSAKKRVRQSEVHRAHNASQRSMLRS